ncbi:MAG: hypothetical protein HRT37_00575 [Alteromonadaceae bacterium]|nr:hypothetical protein [Alteromonadaceae bacterium]
MSISDEIIIIANQLANQGKQPSVALVKAKLSQSVPLPKIVGILKSWQHDPSYISLGENTEKEKTVKKSPTIYPELEKIIEKALMPIHEELSEIKILLNKIMSQTKDK